MFKNKLDWVLLEGVRDGDGEGYCSCFISCLVFLICHVATTTKCAFSICFFLGSKETSATKVVPFNSTNDGEEEEAAMQTKEEKRKPKSFAERRAEMEEEDSKENIEEETKENLDAGPDFEGKWAL